MLVRTYLAWCRYEVNTGCRRSERGGAQTRSGINVDIAAHHTPGQAPGRSRRWARGTRIERVRRKHPAITFTPLLQPGTRTRPKPHTRSLASRLCGEPSNTHTVLICIRALVTLCLSLRWRRRSNGRRRHLAAAQSGPAFHGVSNPASESPL